MGFTPTFYAGRPKLSEVTIDSDLDMGGRAVIAAEGRFDEVDIDTMVKMVDGEMNIVAPARFTDRVAAPYTVTPSNNVYFTANNIARNYFYSDYKTIPGSIVIGPTTMPISPRLLIDASGLESYRSVQIRVYKNGTMIADTGECTQSGTISIDLSDLIEGDVLTFAGRSNTNGASLTVSNFRLAGDVVRYVIDGPTAVEG